MSKRSRDRNVHAALDAIYARVPTVACRGLCAIGCGPILVTPAEADRMKAAHPERRSLRVVNQHRCAYLTKRGRCSVYAVRPLICRVWGAVQRLSCMHGCLPDRWLSDHEFIELGTAIERVGGALCESTPEGLRLRDRGFEELAVHVQRRPDVTPAYAEHLATLTRGARAVHGGHIVGVIPDGRGEHIDIDHE